MWLAGESQPMHYNRRMRDQDLPVLSGPSTYSADHLYEPTRHQHRCRRLKVEATKVSQMQKCKTAYQEHARVVQPHGNAPKCHYGVRRPRHQCRMFETERLNDKNISQTPKVEMAYLECTSAAQPHRKASNQVHVVYRPSRQRDQIKFEPTNVSPMQNGKTAKRPT